MNKLYITLLSIFFLFHCLGQEKHWNDQFLSQTESKKIVKWTSTEDANEWIVIANKKKKLGVYQVTLELDSDQFGNDSLYVGYARNVIPPEYDKIEDFIVIAEEDLQNHEYLQGEHTETAEVFKKKKKGIIVKYGYSYDYQFINAKHFFDEIDWKQIQGSFVPVMNNDLWGIFDWYEQRFLFECEYATVDDLPKTTDSRGFNDYSAEIFREFNKQKDKEKIDMIDMDGNNGDGLFKARSSETQKWGLYQYLGRNNLIEAIPMKYDSLYHFPWNGVYTAVFNDGKVGFYLSYWSYDTDAKQSVECKYDDYKRYITDDQIPKLAVKRDGKWGWVDWLTGEEKSEFKYETPDDLPYPFYEQNMWLDE